MHSFSGAHDGLYEFGDFTLHVGERRLTHRGDPVHVSPKAFDVLAAELIARIAGDGSLARYSTIILPDLGEVGMAAECLDDYVVRGGSRT